MAIEVASMEISIFMESFPDKTESTELLELLFIELVFYAEVTTVGAALFGAATTAGEPPGRAVLAALFFFQ